MRYSFPFGKVPRGADIILYGGGRVGKDYLHDISEQNYCNVLMVADLNADKISIWGGVKVCLPENIFSMDYDYIVIANKDFQEAKKIKQYLEDNGAHDIVYEDARLTCVDTFAQHGEDLFIHVIFRMIGIRYPSYLDLGAHHPFVGSNTALMYHMGSHGVNIEANPKLIENFLHYRKRDININVGVSSTGGRQTFYIFDDFSACNTFSKKEIEYMTNKNPDWKIRGSFEVPTMKVDNIVREYCSGEWPDFLDVDVEGLDYDVLNDANIYNNGPKLILAEVREMQLNDFDIMMQEKGYKRYMRLWTNNFYVRADCMKYLVRENITDAEFYIQNF